MPDTTFSPWLLEREVLMYVIQENPQKLDRYPSDPDRLKFIQLVMDHSPLKYRMYGSAQELLENVSIFSNFPERHQFLNSSEEPYMYPPMIFYNRKNERYICKSDLFVILQNFALENAFESNAHEMLYPLSLYLKTQEENIRGGTEFVRFEESVLKDLENDLKTGLANNPPDEHAKAPEASYAFEEWITDIVSLSVESWSPEKVTSNTVFLLRRFFDSLSPVLRHLTLKMFCLMTESMMKAFQYVIDKRPEMFLPHRNVSNANPITVRLFEDGKQQFVLRQEILLALSRSSGRASSESWDSINEGDLMHTIAVEEVTRKYDVENIEFIRYPILRSKHRGVRIKVASVTSPQFYVLAIDALFEFLREIIFKLRLFQTVDDLWHLLDCVHCFIPHCARPYFISHIELEEMKTNFLKLKTSHGPLSTIQVRNAKKDGFTVQNLKNELAHLNLLAAFPEIQDYAEVVYSEVDKRKKEQFLRTCDLFDAIEHCQLICIFKRCSNLRKFLHNQKSCHRVIGLECSTCPPFDYTLKTCSSEPQNQAASSSEVSKTSESKSSAESNDQKAWTKYFKCEKCQHACEMLNETKKELKSSENNLKNLEKKLAGKEKEMEELKKNQKEKMDKKDKQIQTRMEEIQGLKKRIQEKEKENLNLKNQISKQESSMIQVKDEKLRQEETLKMIQRLLEKQVSQLRQELKDEKQKALEIQNQKMLDQKEIQKKEREIERLKESEVRLRAENEANQRMIQQLMDKLASSGVSSGYRKNSEVSTTSSRIQKCEICWNETSDREAVRCQKCRRPFHQECSSQWLERYLNCPSCDEEFIETTENNF